MATTKFKIWECDFCGYTETVEAKRIERELRYSTDHSKYSFYSPEMLKIDEIMRMEDIYEKPLNWFTGRILVSRKKEKEKWEEKDICPYCLAELKRIND